MKTIRVKWLSPRPVRDVHRNIVTAGTVAELPAATVDHCQPGEFELCAPPKPKRKKRKAPDTEES